MVRLRRRSRGFFVSRSELASTFRTRVEALKTNNESERTVAPWWGFGGLNSTDDPPPPRLIGWNV